MSDDEPGIDDIIAFDATLPRSASIDLEITDPYAVARIFDVPPWLIDGNAPRPRFARLRWRLRRWWPIRPGPAPHSPDRNQD